MSTEVLSFEPANDADRRTLADLRSTFETSDSLQSHRNGQKFKLLGRTPDNEYDRIEPEAGSMWRIQFEDGKILNVYGDEIS